MLLGSAQTRRTRWPPPKHAVAQRSRLRQREDIKHPTLGRVLSQIGHGIPEAQRGRAVHGIQPARNYRAAPPADTGQNGDILLAIGSFVSDRLADNARAHFELPQQVTVVAVKSLEPA